MCFKRKTTSSNKTNAPDKGAGRAVFPPSGQQAIQCALGFEIEICSYRFFRSPGTYGRWLEALGHGEELPEEELHAERPYKKGELMLQGNDFKVETDLGAPTNGSPIFELITEPFEETEAGFRRLSQTFEEIERMTERISEQKEPLMPMRDLEGFGTVPATESEAQLFKPGEPTGHFQFTAGMALDSLPKVFEETSSESEEETAVELDRRREGREQLMSVSNFVSDPLQRHRTRHFHKDVSRSVLDLSTEFPILQDGELAGLAHMIGLYLISASDPVHYVPKTFVSLLSRTDFGTMFSLLSQETKDVLRAQGDKLWMEIFQRLNKELGLLPLNHVIFPYGTHTKILPKGQWGRLASLSRDAWLRGIPFGHDQLCARNYPDPRFAGDLGSLGALADKTDKVGKNGSKRGVILEFRNANKSQHHKAWKSFAEACFRYIYAKNRGLDVTFMEGVEVRD
ncbi:hypothetical protein FUAX_28600 [Fulvitalea axinellae]|uniref:Uncharacterized protein n=1 Tax=Fulvitalea axinellae TaxID=1182444 RepID=A0AAU9CQR5_9BACT|nr:hypothetical protein FUAX_28600 [Fulvitalea axinellae]